MGKKLKGVNVTIPSNQDNVKCMQWKTSDTRRGTYGRMVKSSWPKKSLTKSSTKSPTKSPTKSKSTQPSQQTIYQSSGQEEDVNFDFNPDFPSYKNPKSLVSHHSYICKFLYISELHRVRTITFDNGFASSKTT